MVTIDSVAGSVNALGNQAAEQKKATNQAGPMKERTESVHAGRETSTHEIKSDTVEIKSSRAGDVEAAQNAVENEAEAAALLAQIQNQLQQEEQQQLEQVHNMSSENMIGLLI